MTQSKSEIVVYVPAGGSAATDGIASQSAIVGRPEPEGDHVKIYFEGALYRPENMKTLADRALHAAGRLEQDYPTVAKRFVPREALIAVGIFDPDYGTRPSGMPRFHRLDSTAAEQAAVAKHIPGLQSFAGKRARKEILLQGEFAPRILHVASHAFFRSGEDPLLGSGIALAGANGDDTSGILTGLEMAGMSLRGCQLVVLSACETGLSDSTYGDGLLGMQRSLTLAGSRKGPRAGRID